MTHKASFIGIFSFLSAPCVWASHCNSDLFLLFIWDAELAPCKYDLFFSHLFFLGIITLSFFSFFPGFSCTTRRSSTSSQLGWAAQVEAAASLFSTLRFDFLFLSTVANSCSFHQTWTQLPRNWWLSHPSEVLSTLKLLSRTVLTPFLWLLYWEKGSNSKDQSRVSWIILLKISNHKILYQGWHCLRLENARVLCSGLWAALSSIAERRWLVALRCQAPITSYVIPWFQPHPPVKDSCLKWVTVGIHEEGEKGGCQVFVKEQISSVDATWGQWMPGLRPRGGGE